MALICLFLLLTQNPKDSVTLFIVSIFGGIAFILLVAGLCGTVKTAPTEDEEDRRNAKRW